MNLLIFAGLLVVGLLAILGIVWAIRSESSAAQSVLASSTPTAATTPTVPTSLEKTAVSTQTHRAAEEPPSVTETFPGTREVERSLDSEEESFPMSNGQLQELVSQLQTLHQQSQELERRLSVLTNMVEHIQRSQNSHLSIEALEELETTEVPSTR